MENLNEYLNRYNIDPVPTDVDIILEEKALLAQVAKLYETHGSAIHLVVQNRVKRISKRIIEKAYPAEVPALRLAIIEVIALLEDFEKYVTEYAKQKPKEEPSNAPPVEEGKEGSL